MEVYEIETKIDKLPDFLITQLNDFLEFLLTKYGSKAIDKSKFNFDWEGGLSGLRDQFTAVELQHKSMEWR